VTARHGSEGGLAERTSPPAGISPQPSLPHPECRVGLLAVFYFNTERSQALALIGLYNARRRHAATPLHCTRRPLTGQPTVTNLMTMHS
jgi:hypothetical protein